MKTVCLAIVTLLLSLSSYAQSGAVNFANRLSGVFDAPVLIDADGPEGAGEVGAVAQLYIVNGTTLTAVGMPISFRGTSGALAKYFDGGTLDLPGTAVGGNVTLRVRAWVGASFASSGLKGESADFVITNLGGGTLPASNLDTLKPFTIWIPEPHSIALLLLGTATMFFVARRR